MLLVLLALPAFALASPLFTRQQSSSTAISKVTAAQWAQLNATVGGRLYQNYPYARPCFALASSGTNGQFNAQQCQAAQNGWKNDTDIANAPGGYMQPNWGDCQATGAECELDYEAPQDPAAYAPPRTCSQGSVPSYYVDVQQYQDIQAVLAFAKNYSVPITVKSSGHDYKGRSSAPNTLMIWMHHMTSGPSLNQNFVAAGCSGSGTPAMTFGAGHGFLELYQFAEANQVTLVGGSSETVVAGGGWVSGGGHSALSNTLGLGVDRTLEMQVVLPNGTYITASRCQNPDIFFALRGGGGGIAGIATQVTMAVAPRLTLQVAYIRFVSINPTSAAQFLQLCIQNALQWAAEGWGGYIQPGAMTSQASGFVLMTPLLNNSAATASMKNLTNFAASLGNVALNNEVVQANSFYQAYTTYLQPNEEAVGVGAAISSQLIPKTNFEPANQQALFNAMQSGANTIGSNVLEPSAPGLVYGGAPFQILVTAPTNYPGDNTSSVTPAWRNAVWHTIYATTLNYNSGSAGARTAFAKATAAANPLRAICPPGAYQNEADVHQPNYQESFWGTENYNKLTAIKTQLDPNNTITCWNCINWQSSDQRYQCYV